MDLDKLDSYRQYKEEEDGNELDRALVVLSKHPLAPGMYGMRRIASWYPKVIHLKRALHVRVSGRKRSKASKTRSLLSAGCKTQRYA